MRNYRETSPSVSRYKALLENLENSRSAALTSVKLGRNYAQKRLDRLNRNIKNAQTYSAMLGISGDDELLTLLDQVKNDHRSMQSEYNQYLKQITSQAVNEPETNADAAGETQSFWKTLLDVISGSGSKDISQSIADKVAASQASAQQQKVYAERYTPDTIEANWDRILELIGKETLSDAEKDEARAAYKAINQYIRSTSMDRLLHGTETDYQKIADYAAASNSLRMKDGSISSSLSVGFLSAFPFAEKLLTSDGAMDNRSLGLSEDIGSVVKRDIFEDARNSNQVGFAAGNIAGDLAILGALGEIAGALGVGAKLAESGSWLGRLAAKAVRTGTIFATKTGTQSAGKQDWSDPGAAILNTLEDAGKSGISAAAGAIGSEFVSAGLAAVLAKNELMTPFMEFARQTMSGTTFGAVSLGTEQALTPEEERMTKEELAQQFTVLFLFSVISAGIEAIQTLPAEKAKLDSAVTGVQNDLNSIMSGAKTPKEVQEAAERVLGYTHNIRTAIEQNYYPGQQKYIDEVLRALDAVDQFAATLSEAAGKTVVPGNLLTDGSASVISEAGFDISPSGFPSASGGMTVPAGAKPPISNGASFGTTPGMAAAVAAQGVLENRPAPISDDAPNPYAALLAGLHNRLPTPAELDNFHLLLPHATDEDIQAFLEQDGERMEDKDNWTDNDETAIISTGGRITDPFSKEAEKFAKMYYEEIRHFSTDAARIAKATGYDESDIHIIKRYLFIDQSYYDSDTEKWRRFDEDCAIAQSWQRLMTGKDIKPHDLTLIKHELMEMELEKNNPEMTHEEAHALATKRYNYQKEADEYYAYIAQYKEKH